VRHRVVIKMSTSVHGKLNLEISVKDRVKEFAEKHKVVKDKKEEIHRIVKEKKDKKDDPVSATKKKVDPVLANIGMLVPSIASSLLFEHDFIL
jgi:hypothetical protein